MKQIILTAVIASTLTYAIVTFHTSEANKVKDNDNIPEFYWNDRVVPPHNGFELKVDMYWNETKDTIYMEYSSGPEGE
jgi:hypothetical protein